MSFGRGRGRGAPVSSEGNDDRQNEPQPSRDDLGRGGLSANSNSQPASRGFGRGGGRGGFDSGPTRNESQNDEGKSFSRDGPSNRGNFNNQPSGRGFGRGGALGGHNPQDNRNDSQNDGFSNQRANSGFPRGNSNDQPPQRAGFGRGGSTYSSGRNDYQQENNGQGRESYGSQNQSYRGGSFRGGDQSGGYNHGPPRDNFNNQNEERGSRGGYSNRGSRNDNFGQNDNQQNQGGYGRGRGSYDGPQNNAGIGRGGGGYRNNDQSGDYNRGPPNGRFNDQAEERGNSGGNYNNQGGQEFGNNSYGRGGASSRGSRNDNYGGRNDEYQQNDNRNQGNYGRNDYQQQDSYSRDDRNQSNYGGGSFQGGRGRGGYSNDGPSAYGREGAAGRGNEQYGRGGFERGPSRGGYSNDSQNDGSSSYSRGGYSGRGNDQSGRGNYGRGGSNSNDGSSSFGRGGYSGRGNEQSGRGGYNSNNFQDDGSSYGRGGHSDRGGFSRGSSRGGYNNNSQNDGPSTYGRGGYSGRGNEQSGRGTSRGGYNNDNRSGGNYDAGGNSSGRGGFRGNSGGGDGGNACFNCQQTGHLSRDCPEPRAPRGESNSECFNCKQTGHFSRDCPQPRQNMGGGPNDVCFNCKQPGHFSRDCLEPSQIPEKEQSFIPEVLTADQAFDEAKKSSMAPDIYSEDDKVQVENYPEDLRVFENWSDAEFSEQILKNIARREDYIKPREFQSKTMPIVMEGYDLKGQAETGSGKTAAFLLPIIQKLSTEFANSEENRDLKVSALIIEPTRELADQLFQQAKMFADKTNVRVNVTYGKVKMQYTMNSLRQDGCDLLIATPGRIVHLIRDKLVDVEGLKYFVLDEADELLNESFMQDIENIAQALPLSENRQTLFFSATLAPETHDLAKKFCKPNSVVVRSANSGANRRITQNFIHVPFDNRREFLVDFLTEARDKHDGEMPKTLVFVQTKHEANLLAFRFAKMKDMTPRSVNGDLPQAEREKATHEFRTGNTRILITTNVFSRGLDIADLGAVINMELPDASEPDCRIKYIHRIGRTGRTARGTATTFFDPNHQNDIEMAPMIIEELERANQEVPEIVRAAVDPSIKVEVPNLNLGGNAAEPEAPIELEEPEF